MNDFLLQDFDDLLDSWNISDFESDHELEQKKRPI